MNKPKVYIFQGLTVIATPLAELEDGTLRLNKPRAIIQDPVKNRIGLVSLEGFDPDSAIDVKGDYVEGILHKTYENLYIEATTGIKPATVLPGGN